MVIKIRAPHKGVSIREVMFQLNQLGFAYQDASSSQLPVCKKVMNKQLFL